MPLLLLGRRHRKLRLWELLSQHNRPKGVSQRTNRRRLQRSMKEVSVKSLVHQASNTAPHRLPARLVALTKEHRIVPVALPNCLRSRFKARIPHHHHNSPIPHRR